ncbi:Uncharacterised protein [Mycobacterium tuberculosis]|nr:Uncharacterised protein [Mycobacterium tuberculosis]CKU04648.1 Uncharacterised protein [Mycobacterium tuberculosis]CKU33028.1 Uncharacterised protein [Mycobacterium tuberculosis]CKW80357.1 Uncharacterised protein [Mycobacterium tuberculosis]COY22995.1 Uncharacterised protein [Mycobacterium tuberculosis]
MSGRGPSASCLLSHGVNSGVTATTARALINCTQPYAPTPSPLALISIGTAAKKPISVVSVARPETANRTRRLSESACR